MKKWIIWVIIAIVVIIVLVVVFKKSSSPVKEAQKLAETRITDATKLGLVKKYIEQAWNNPDAKIKDKADANKISYAEQLYADGIYIYDYNKSQGWI